MSTLVQSRLRRIYIYYGVQNMQIGIPVIVLYMQANNITLSQFFLLQSIYSICTLLLEVPSGYLSDRWQRKYVLSFAALFTALGTLFYGFSTTFIWFAVAEIVYAFGSSFISGTIESITHDTVIESKDAHTRAPMRHIFFIKMSTQAIAALATGFVATISLQYAILGRFPFMIIAFFLSFLLHEPIRKKMPHTNHYKAIAEIGTHVIAKNIPLRGIIIISSLISMLTFVLFWLTQTYQAEVNLPLTIFGLIQATMLLSAAFCSREIKWLEKRFDDRILLIGISTIIIGSFLLLSLPISIWGFLVLLVGRAMYGAFLPLTTDLINHLTTSDIRATVLSLNALAARLAFAILGPIVGYAVDALSLTTACLLVGIASGIVLFTTFFSLRRVWELIPDTKG